MSTYNKQTKHPVTKEWEVATWADDYYGNHRYGVVFSNGDTFDPEKIKLETREEKIEEKQVNPKEAIGTPQWRKERPVYSGVLAYFPDAIMEVAYASWVGNEQHNAGQPLHWDRSKSKDQLDACTRHLIDNSKNPIDTDGVYHLAKEAWRAMAELQIMLENAPKE